MKNLGACLFFFFFFWLGGACFHTCTSFGFRKNDKQKRDMQPTAQARRANIEILFRVRRGTKFVGTVHGTTTVLCYSKTERMLKSDETRIKQ